MTENKVSCAVIQDLLPLVEDGIASAESVQLVKEHLSQCTICNHELQIIQAPSDERIIRKIQMQITKYALGIILIGGIVGSSLSYSMEFMHNILLMPCLGIVCVFLLKHYWFRGVLLILAASYVSCIVVIVFIQQERMAFFNLMTSPLFYIVIYGLFLLIGVFVGKLLHFAWKGKWL